LIKKLDSVEAAKTGHDPLQQRCALRDQRKKQKTYFDEFQDDDDVKEKVKERLLHEQKLSR
jgi:osmotically-inducible protein OsmY